jgi:hypothetical protein
VNVSSGGRVGVHSTKTGIAVPMASLIFACFCLTYFSESPVDPEALGILQTQNDALSLQENEFKHTIFWKNKKISELSRKIKQDAATNANRWQASNAALLKATTEQSTGHSKCEENLEKLITAQETNCKKTEDDNAHNEAMENTFWNWLCKIFNFLYWVVWFVTTVAGCLFCITTGNAFFKKEKKKANTSTKTKTLECFEIKGSEQKTPPIQPEVGSTAIEVVQRMCTGLNDKPATQISVGPSDFLRLMDEEARSGW